MYTTLLCLVLIGIVVAGEANTDLEDTHEQLVEEVRAQEQRIVRLEIILDKFLATAVHLTTLEGQEQIQTAVDASIEKEAPGNNIVGAGILIGALILFAVAIAALVVRLSLR